MTYLLAAAALALLLFFWSTLHFVAVAATVVLTVIGVYKLTLGKDSNDSP